MAEEVYMDVPQVEAMAKSFGTAGEVLAGVANTLEVISSTLKATAFVGLVGGYAVSAYLDRIAPRMSQAAQKMDELQNDINSAANAYRNGDALGSTRFF
jgi:hypothetical protein